MLQALGAFVMKSHGDTPTRQSEVLHNAISSGHTEPGAEHSPSQPPTRPETAASSHDTVVGSDSFGTRYEIAERSDGNRNSVSQLLCECIS